MTGMLKIMNGSGHTTVKWSTDLQETVDAANRTFNEMLAQGYTAFAVSGATGEQIAEFDVDAENIVLIPRMVGG